MFRWNVGMPRFPADPDLGLRGKPKRGSSVKHCIGDSVSDTSIERLESCATAALARIRERNRRRQSVSDPCGYRRSEERRVGKECRYEWGRYRCRKKKWRNRI